MRALGLVMRVEGQVRVKARYPPRFRGLGVWGEGPRFKHVG